MKAQLTQCGGRVCQIDGEPVVEMVDPNDNAQRRFQYRRLGDTLERRILQADGTPFLEGSRWEPIKLEDLVQISSRLHLILDVLEF